MLLLGELKIENLTGVKKNGSYVKSVKVMGSYAGLIICTVYFNEMQQHDIVHKASLFWFGTARARWFIAVGICFVR